MPKNATADRWHVLANELFMRYVRARLSSNPRAWGDFGPGGGVIRHDTQQAHAMRIAVHYKNRFADFLADLSELPDQADIRDRWGAAMREAEADIARYLASAPEPGTLALT